MMRSTFADPRTQIGLSSYNYAAFQHPPGVSTRYLIDVNSLRDPQGQKLLRTTCTDGRAKEVQEWIKVDPRVSTIISAVRLIAAGDIDADKAGFLTIAIVDHHGKWISPAIVEILANDLSEKGYFVGTLHQSLGGA